MGVIVQPADKRPRFSVVARFENGMFFSEAPDSMGNRILASTGFVQVLPKSSLERKNVPHTMLFAETHKRCLPFRPSYAIA